MSHAASAGDAGSAFDFSATTSQLWNPDSVSEWSSRQQQPPTTNNSKASPPLSGWDEKDLGWVTTPAPSLGGSSSGGGRLSSSGSPPRVAHVHSSITESTSVIVEGYNAAFIDAVAAVVIQTTVRRYLALRVAKDRLGAIRSIQSFVRRHAKKRKKRQFRNAALRMYDMAAIQIQTIFRGWWVRDCLSVDHYCATIIQKLVRGYLGRLNYQFDMYRVTIVQTIYRRNRAMDESAGRLAMVIVIQSIYRGYLARKAVGHLLAERRERASTNGAATVIQSRWRSFDVQMNFMHTLADILIVQSVARRWLTMKLVVPYMQAEQLGGTECVVMDEYSRERFEREQMNRFRAMSTTENDNVGIDELLKAWKDRDTKHRLGLGGRGTVGPSGGARSASPHVRRSASPLSLHPRRNRLAGSVSPPLT